ncbi:MULTISPECIES: hypothetical protein [Paenibacillus]|nr:hypothetical protein [Paenibacillus sp. EKM211P]MEE4561957.1 hypothetical protein [Paenibacillus polymyxa]
MYERVFLVLMSFSRLKMKRQSKPFINIQPDQVAELGMVSMDGY